MYKFQSIEHDNVLPSERDLLKGHGFEEAISALAENRCAKAVRAALASQFYVPPTNKQCFILSSLPQSSFFGDDELLAAIRAAASLKPRLDRVAERSGATLVTEPGFLRENLVQYNEVYYLRLHMPNKTPLAIEL